MCMLGTRPACTVVQLAVPAPHACRRQFLPAEMTGVSLPNFYEKPSEDL